MFISLFVTQVGVGVEDESKFVKKADDLIEISFGESGMSGSEPTGDAGSSATTHTHDDGGLHN